MSNLTPIQKIIKYNAYDDYYGVWELLCEFSQEFNVNTLEAFELLRKESDFIESVGDIVFTKSTEPFGKMTTISPKEFFKEIKFNMVLFENGPPYYYISRDDTCAID